MVKVIDVMEYLLEGLAKNRWDLDSDISVEGLTSKNSTIRELKISECRYPIIVIKGQDD